MQIEGEPVRLPAGIDLTAYRLVQEGLTNAIKHASAEHAEIRVRYATGYVEVEVVDDGRGVNGRTSSGGHGLLGMRERVSIYGETWTSGLVRKAASGCEHASRCEHDRGARGLACRGYPMSLGVLIADDQALVRAGFRLILEAEADLDVVARQLMVSKRWRPRSDYARTSC